jgi:hypothetical protein
MGKRQDGMPVDEHKLKQNKEELKWVSDKRDIHKNRLTNIKQADRHITHTRKMV